jgi:hypothetical protein
MLLSRHSVTRFAARRRGRSCHPAASPPPRPPARLTVSTRRHCPACRSHTRAVPSSEPVAHQVASGDTASALMRPSCPASSKRHEPVCRSHSLRGEGGGGGGGESGWVGGIRISGADGSPAKARRPGGGGCLTRSCGTMWGQQACQRGPARTGSPAPQAATPAPPPPTPPLNHKLAHT